MYVASDIADSSMFETIKLLPAQLTFNMSPESVKVSKVISKGHS